MNISGKGNCTVDAGTSKSGVLCRIRYNKGWWRWTTIIADPITFLIVAELVCRHVLKNSPGDGPLSAEVPAFKWDGKIGTNDISLDIPDYVLPNLSPLLADAGKRITDLLREAAEVKAARDGEDEGTSMFSAYLKARCQVFPDAERHPDHTTVQ